MYGYQNYFAFDCQVCKRDLQIGSQEQVSSASCYTEHVFGGSTQKSACLEGDRGCLILRFSSLWNLLGFFFPLTGVK